MKKALIDQFMLIIALFWTLVAIGATVADESEMRATYYELEAISKASTRALSKNYRYNKDMQEANDIARDIIQSTALGKKLLENGNIKFIWKDMFGNTNPDAVSTQISGFKFEGFWYKFLGQNLFDIPIITHSEYTDSEFFDTISFDVKFGGQDAAYYNIIGTYELDSNGCIINPKIIFVDKKTEAVGSKIYNYSDINTRLFIIADGYSKYGSSVTVDTPVYITNNCSNTPNVTINGISNAAPIYFQDTNFNRDNGYDHMREIGKTYYDTYKDFLSGKFGNKVRKCKDGYSVSFCNPARLEVVTVANNWEGWVLYADDKSIFFEEDPNDEYIIAMEDLPDGGDKDFDDILLDTTKIKVPQTVEEDNYDFLNGTIVSEVIPTLN